MSHRPPPYSASIRVLGLVLVLLSSCKPSEKSTATAEPPRNTALAEARIDSAKLAAPDEALALLVSALKADPTSEEARAHAENLLRETHWSVPILMLQHPFPIEHLAFSPPSNLWVSLAGDQNTALRWNLDSLHIESLLFPVAVSSTNSFVFDTAHRALVMQRGSVMLLCDAISLKPIYELGPLPESCTPISTIVFSPDGLLMAHPTVVSGEDPSIIWHLRDVATGQIIRSSDPGAGQPLSAILDRTSLRVIHGDGSRMDMPVSPIEPIRVDAAAEPVHLLHAQFSNDGNSLLALQDGGPHRPPNLITLPDAAVTDGSLEMESLMKRFPWTHQPSPWNGLLRDRGFRVQGSMLSRDQHAPIRANSPITAVLYDGSTLIVGEENGGLTQHRLLPLPLSLTNEQPPAVLSPNGIAALENLALAVSGIVFESRSFRRLTPDERTASMKKCDLTSLRTIFPKLDFSDIAASLAFSPLRRADSTAMTPIAERLAQSAPVSPPPPNVVEITEIFRSGDPLAIHAAIRNAGGNGPTAATALAISLTSEHPDWIEGCLATAVDLPPLLRRIAESRISLLLGRKAEALAEWPEIFPDLAAVRLREDWLGWEQADFEPALELVRQAVQEELTAIQIAENSTPEQRKAVIAHLSNPQTLESVGKRRFAEACLKAARVLADLNEDTPTAFQLANFARNQGAAPEPCLRVEAIALTNLGDFQNAQKRWIELITEHPVETHQPGDYAEAAYTSFENSDPRQAMEILTTGIHRFPKDGNFALRAGWVALLTGNSEKAYRFLREGQRIGFPPAKQENAIALLTIAASQSGAEDDATVYFNELLRIDPAWNDPATLDTLDWPDELKFTLQQFMQ